MSLVLISKLYLIQIVNHENYLTLGDRQYIKKNSVIIDRGDIYFTKKDGNHILAASMQDSFTLYINPKAFFTYIKSVKNKESKSEDQLLEEVKKSVLSVLLLKDDDLIDFENKLYKLKDKKSDIYLELVKDLNDEQQKQIRGFNYEFIGIGKEKKRYYPGNELSSNVIGIVGFKGDEFAGRYGLEKQYENILNRKSSVYNNFFVDLFVGTKKAISDSKNMEGDIYTSIEPIVQKELENKISNIQQKQNSDLTGSIIMNPNTGEIIAMAKVPTFYNDNKKYDIDNYKNDMIESSYEMGSIIKPLTMSVGIDVGAIHADSKYNDLGSVKVKDRVFSNFDKKARGYITMQQALSQSLNTGFVHIAKLVGNEVLTKYFYSFAMNKKTGIDLPNESAPLTSNLEKGDVEHATVSFGQGIAMSPIGTIRALSVIANGGYIVKPHVVNKIKYKLGNFKDIKYDFENKEPLLKQSTVEEIRSMLVHNVDNSLLSGKRKDPRHSVAAKTGTAQIASSGGGYIEGKNIHTFIGFLPAYDPKFIVFIYTVDPKNSRYSSESLASSFFDLSDFLISYYQIPADR